MPSKRDPHRQRRQARNRAERQAREARRAAAQAAASPTSSAPTRRRRWGGGRAARQSPPAPQSTEAAAASGGTPPTTPARPRGGSFAGKPPGSRAAFLSLLFAVGALASVLFLQVPVDEGGSPLSSSEVDERDERREAGEDVPELERNAFAALWPLSVLYVLPIGVGAIAVRGTRAARPGRVWMRSLIAITVFAIVSGIPILYFPMVLALAVASFQSRRADAQAAPATRPDADGPATSGEVIDVDEVDEPAAPEVDGDEPDDPGATRP